jgi:hypothetical protein
MPTLIYSVTLQCTQNAQSAPHYMRCQQTLQNFQNIHPAHGSSPILQARHNDRSILHRCTVRPLILHHKVHRKTQLATPLPRRSLSKCPVHNLGIIHNTGHVISSAHEPLVLSRATVDILREDFHHVFFRVGRLVSRAMSILRDIEHSVVVKKAEDVALTTEAEIIWYMVLWS